MHSDFKLTPWVDFIPRTGAGSFSLPQTALLFCCSLCCLTSFYLIVGKNEYNEGGWGGGGGYIYLYLYICALAYLSFMVHNSNRLTNVVQQSSAEG